MDARLLLLGLLRSQAMHGYQLSELIESHLGTGVHLTRPTAYRLLNKMTADGWITYREEQEGNYPARRVYSMSPAGETAFQRLLRKEACRLEDDDQDLYAFPAFMEKREVKVCEYCESVFEPDEVESECLSCGAQLKTGTTV